MDVVVVERAFIETRVSTFNGFFKDLLLEAQRRGLLKLEPGEKSGGYTVCAVA